MSKRIRQHRRNSLLTPEKVKEWALKTLTLSDPRQVDIYLLKEHFWINDDIFEPYYDKYGHQLPDQEFICFHCLAPGQSQPWHYTAVPSIRRVFFTSPDTEEWDRWGARKLTEMLQKKFGKPR